MQLKITIEVNAEHHETFEIDCDAAQSILERIEQLFLDR
jgi:hypothetical protein